MEKNVHAWVRPQGLAGQELIGFGRRLSNDLCHHVPAERVGH